MQCGYCGSQTYGGETRCRTCGCRADDTLTREFSPTNGALAEQPRVAAHAAVQPITRGRAAEAVERGTARRAVPRQDPLFEERPGLQLVPDAPNRAPKPSPAGRRRRPAHQTQTKLDFDSAPPTKKKLGTTVEAAIYCEDPVATVWHRAIAAAFDWSMVAIGFGLFVLIFHFFFGGRFDLHNRLNLGMLAGMLGLIGMTYGLMWTLAGRDSAGMRWAQLQITTFDGFPPEPRHRLLRFVGSCLSLCTLIGLLWSLADEESLTWQDHMSGTFPTPVPLDPDAHA